jgi:hypothetical protein
MPSWGTSKSHMLLQKSGRLYAFHQAIHRCEQPPILRNQDESVPYAFYPLQIAVAFLLLHLRNRILLCYTHLYTISPANQPITCNEKGQRAWTWITRKGSRMASGLLFPPGVLIDGQPFSYDRLSERKPRRKLDRRLGCGERPLDVHAVHHPSHK